MRRILPLIPAVLALGFLSACATVPEGDAAPPAAAPIPSMASAPAGAVLAQGTVLENPEGIELCLGAVLESLPPRCSGIPLKGWDWDAVEGWDEASDTRWGAYALHGSFDGTSFTVTEEPVMLALFDPMPFPDPTEGREGKTPAEDLEALSQTVSAELGDALVGSVVDRGYLWLDVAWDDGTLQQAMDAEHGPGVVIVRSALRATE